MKVVVRDRLTTWAVYYTQFFRLFDELAVVHWSKSHTCLDFFQGRNSDSGVHDGVGDFSTTFFYQKCKKRFLSRKIRARNQFIQLFYAIFSCADKLSALGDIPMGTI